MGIQVVKDEADKRREEMRDKRREAAGAGDLEGMARYDTSALKNGDTSKRYRWINKHEKRVDTYKVHGYVVSPKGSVQPQFELGSKTSGAIENGDLILMETSRANYERRVAQARRKGELWESSGRDQARERINKIARDGGVAKPFEDVAFDESSNA